MMKAPFSSAMPRRRSGLTGNQQERRRQRRSPGLLQHSLGPVGRGLVVSAAAWSIAWKGASLWRASRDDSKPWFVALLLSNTLGILDAIYLFGVSRTNRRERKLEESVLARTGEPEQLGHRQET